MEQFNSAHKVTMEILKMIHELRKENLLILKIILKSYDNQSQQYKVLFGLLDNALHYARH